MDNSRCRIVDAMLGCLCNVSAFDLQRSMCRLSKIDVSTFEDRWSMCRPLKIDDQCVDFRRSMCRLSKIDVSTFGDRCIDLRKLMCRPSKIDDRCEIMLLHLLKTLIPIVVCELWRGFALQCFHSFIRNILVK